jgi:hypothetical protein
MEGLLPGSSPAFEDETAPAARSSKPWISAACRPQLGENVGMKPPVGAVVAAVLLAAAAACGGRPAELVPPVGEVTVVDPEAELPKLRFADGLISANDRCPVTKRKLSPYFPPVYVNGLPIGFC